MDEINAEFPNDLDAIKLIRKVKVLGVNDAAECCGVCQNEKYTHAAMPCRCFNVCKKCAMKMATGGKCQLCNEYFTHFKLIVDA